MHLSLRELQLKERYITGEDDLVEEFYIPCITRSLTYDRAAGFFNSMIYLRIREGMEPFIRRGGKIRLITSAKLTPHDVEKIREGYEERQWLKEHLLSLYDDFYKNRHDYNVANLCWLIKCGRLDIRITIPDMTYVGELEAPGIFHDKIGIFSDEDQNDVVFFGSNNESIGGWVNNFESFEVYCSWEQGVAGRAQKRKDYFEDLWNGRLKAIHTHPFPQVFKDKLIEIAPEHFLYDETAATEETSITFIPRGCQSKALEYFGSSRYRVV